MTDTARFGRTLITIDKANRLLAINEPDPRDVTNWVDPNKRRLTERLASAKASERELIRNLLFESMNRGETGEQAAGRVSDFLTPLSDQVRRANPINGRSGKGSSRLRTIARTELSRAHGQATIEAAELNPFVAGVKWNLSRSHPEPDECDGKAQNSSRGLPEGVYRPGEVPPYPTHPNCLCFLSQVVVRKTASIVRELIARERRPLRDSPFFIADDIDEANVFAREVLGVDADYANDLQIANLTNRAMWDTKSQGRALPGSVDVRRLPDSPGTYAQYDPNIDTLIINRDELRFFKNDILAREEFDRGWFAASDRIGLIHHELGHVDHWKKNPSGYVSAFHHVPDPRLERVMGEVSQYAKQSFEEFIAETNAGRFAGRRYSDEVNDLYDQVFNMKIRGRNLDEALDEVRNLEDNFLNLHPIAAGQSDAARIAELQRRKEAFERELEILRQRRSDIQARLALARQADDRPELLRLQREGMDIGGPLGNAERQLDSINAQLSNLRKIEIGKFPGADLPEIQITRHKWLQDDDAFEAIKEWQEDIRRANPDLFTEANIRAAEDWADTEISHSWLQNWLRHEGIVDDPNDDIFRVAERVGVDFPGDPMETDGFDPKNFRQQFDDLIGPYVRKWDQELYDAIEKGGDLPDQIIAYRYVNQVDLPVDHPLRNIQQGDVIRTDGYASTSTGLDFIREATEKNAEDSVIFELRIPRNTRALNMDEWTTVHHEKEILLPKNTEITILGRIRERIIGAVNPESTIGRQADNLPTARAQGVDKAAELRRISPFDASERPVLLVETDKKFLEDHYGALIKSAEDPGAEDIIEAIRNYNSPTYRDINTYLRTGDVTPEWYAEMRSELEDFYEGFDNIDMDFQLSQELHENYLPEIQTFIDNLDRGMEASTTPYDLVSFRGIRTIEDTPFKDVRIGDEILDKGFVSTTLNEDFMKQWIKTWPNGMPTEIFVPKGTKSMYIRGITGSTIEDELVLNRNMVFRMAGIFKDRRLLEVIPQNRPFQIPVVKAQGRRYQDISDETLEDTIRLMFKTPSSERTREEIGRLAELLRERDIREVNRTIGRLDPAPPVDLRPVNDIREQRLFDDASEFWNDTKSSNPDLYQAGKDYTHGDFREANKFRRLHGGNITKEPEFSPTPLITNIDEQLDEMFRRVQVDEDLVLFRNTRRPSTGRSVLHEDPQIGDEFIDHGFVSTTVDEDALRGLVTGVPDRVLEIRVPRGTPGEYFRPIGLSQEKELVLGPGLRYRIVGRGDEAPSGVVKAIIEVVPEPQEIREARRLSQFPREINPPDMRAILDDAPISKAQIKYGKRTFRTEEQIVRYYDTNIRLAVTQAQKDLFEAQKQDAIALWRKAQPSPISPLEKEMMMNRFLDQEGPVTRFQLRDVPLKERQGWIDEVAARKEFERLNPEQKRLRQRASDTFAGNPTKRYPRLLTPEELGEITPEELKRLAKNAEKGERKKIQYIDSNGNTITRDELLSDYYKRLARSQTGGQDFYGQALRASPDQFARDEQWRTIRDALDRIWGFKPLPESKGPNVFLRDAGRITDPITIQPAGNPIIIPRRKDVTPILIKRKGRSKVERVIIPREPPASAPAPVAHARPQALVMRDVINGGPTPELNTRFRNLEPEDLLRNFKIRTGIDPVDLIDDFPSFPYARSFDEAKEIADEVLMIGMDLGFDRTKPNLYGSIMNQLHNGIVEQMMRGEPAPSKFMVMGLDEVVMTHGIPRPAEGMTAGYFRGGDLIMANADQTQFWASDKMRNEYFASGWSSSPERMGTVIHEIGHWLHHHQDPDMPALHKEEWNDIAALMAISQRVGRYAAKNEKEFVAEMYSGIRAGRDDLLADDLLELYDIVGGPLIRGIFDRER